MDLRSWGQTPGSDLGLTLAGPMHHLRAGIFSCSANASAILNATADGSAKEMFEVTDTTRAIFADRITEQRHDLFKRLSHVDHELPLGASPAVRMPRGSAPAFAVPPFFRTQTWTRMKIISSA